MYRQIIINITMDGEQGVAKVGLHPEICSYLFCKLLERTVQGRGGDRLWVWGSKFSSLLISKNGIVGVQLNVSAKPKTTGPTQRLCNSTNSIVVVQIKIPTLWVMMGVQLHLI